MCMCAATLPLYDMLSVTVLETQNESAPSKHKTFCITFVQRRPNVFDVGPALYKCYTNVLRLLRRKYRWR